MIEIRPIGVIHTPFESRVGVPIQGLLTADHHAGTVEVDPRWADALVDVEGFSHLILIYLFHGAKVCEQTAVKPFMDDVEHGIFAVRSPLRPNPIGLTTVRFVARRGNLLEVDGVDMLDGTPLLDIKPYLPEFDSFPDATSGWADRGLRKPELHHADDRFGG